MALGPAAPTSRSHAEPVFPQVPPGPLGGLVKGISSAQVRAMLGDLRAEAARINAGSPTPSPNDVGLADEFGFEGGGGSSPAPGAAPPGGAAAAALR